MISALASAEAALERGDYGQCIALLEPIAQRHPLPSREGAMVRMLMLTAWMGQGEEEKAISTCRLLTHCKDNEIRQRARQLLSVLEAPSLERPENWSIQLPEIDVLTLSGKTTSQGTRKPKSSSEVKFNP